MLKNPLRIGVVGLGMVREHLRRYKEVPGAICQAICDLSSALLAQVGDEFSVPQRLADFSDFIANAEVDAVSLAVPNYLHKEMTLAALDAGLHVMCDKPMAMNTAEAIEMRDRVRESGKKFMIHFNQRFRPEHPYFRNLIKGGELGEVYYASAGWRRMRGMPRFGGWFGQKKM